MKNLLYVFGLLFLMTPQYIKAQPLGKDPFFDSIFVAAHTLADTERVRSFCNLSDMIAEDDIALSRRWLDTAKMLFPKHPTAFTDGLAKSIGERWRTCEYRIVIQISLKISGKFSGRRISP